MTTGYSRSPKLLKGAFIQFSSPLFVPIPNVIVFQYNPETLTRTLTPWVVPTPHEWDAMTDNQARAQRLEGLRQPYDPDESFNVVLEVDAADALEDPDSHPVAMVSGVADRIAALEMLCYPAADSVLGSLFGSVSTTLQDSAVGLSIVGGEPNATAHIVPAPKVPVVLFFWGPGRILPVRITSFSVEEQAYSPTLYPLRAKVSVGLKVLTPDAFDPWDPTFAEKLAKAAYKFTRAQKNLLATANLINDVESIVSMLPS